MCTAVGGSGRKRNKRLTGGEGYLNGGKNKRKGEMTNDAEKEGAKEGADDQW